MFLRPSGLRTRFLVAFFVAAAGLTGAAEEGGTIASIPRRAVTEAMALSMATFQFSSRSIIVSRSVIRLQFSTDVEFGICLATGNRVASRSEEHTSELQSLRHLVCR